MVAYSNKGINIHARCVVFITYFILFNLSDEFNYSLDFSAVLIFPEISLNIGICHIFIVQ
jgi:hypothetical protein